MSRTERFGPVVVLLIGVGVFLLIGYWFAHADGTPDKAAVPNVPNNVTVGGKPIDDYLDAVDSWLSASEAAESAYEKYQESLYGMKPNREYESEWYACHHREQEAKSRVGITQNAYMQMNLAMSPEQTVRYHKLDERHMRLLDKVAAWAEESGKRDGKSPP